MPGTDSILIVSNHSLFAEAIAHVLQHEGIGVVATVPSLRDALPLMQSQRPGAVIVDCGEPCRPDAEMVSLLLSTDVDTQVVFLTLADNRMIVHQWQQVGDATPADLVSVLRYRAPGLVGPEANA